MKSQEDSIYEYLVGENKDTFTNSALLWKKFKDVLTNNVSDMKVMDHYWLEMKKLQCNGVEEFEMFYNNFIIILNKLIKFNSIAATDNTFLCSIVFHKIDIPELAAEVLKLILADKTHKAKDIMDNILKEAKALTLGQSTTISCARKATITSFPNQKQEAYKKKVAFKPTPFPKNEHNHMPGDVYCEMREWYQLAAISEDKKSKKEYHDFRTFKFASLSKWKTSREVGKKRAAVRKAEILEKKKREDELVNSNY